MASRGGPVAARVWLCIPGPFLRACLGIWVAVEAPHVRASHFLGPGGGLCAEGRLEHRQGLTVSQEGLLLCRQPRWYTALRGTVPEPSRELPPAAHFQIHPRAAVEAGVSQPQPSALLWCPLLESVQTKPASGPGRLRLLPPRTSAGQSRTAERTTLGGGQWLQRNLFLASLEHNHLHDPQIQSAPRTPHSSSQRVKNRSGSPLCSHRETSNESELLVLEACLGNEVFAAPQGSMEPGGAQGPESPPSPGIYAAPAGIYLARFKTKVLRRSQIR